MSGGIATQINGGEQTTIAVLGATGRTGAPIARQLLSAGHKVLAVGRSAERLKRLVDLGAQACCGLLADRAFLTSVLQGASAAFVLSPADFTAPDVNAAQTKNVESIAAAVREASVSHVVSLSSWGAELTEKSGGIIGCHLLEELLNTIPGLNVVHLRPVWFMENFLWNIPLIKMAGINGLAINPATRFPIIAARDIAPVAVDYLAKLDFRGRNIQYLSGPRDYTMVEVTRILGASIGNSNLRYIQFPAAIMRKGLIESGGLSPDAANLAIETNDGIDSGRIKAELRSTSNTTPTTLEEFAHSTFAPMFHGAPAAKVADRFGGFFLRSLLYLTGRRAA